MSQTGNYKKELKPPKKEPKPPASRQGMYCKKCGRKNTTKIESYWFFSKWECNYHDCKYISTYIL